MSDLQQRAIGALAVLVIAVLAVWISARRERRRESTARQTLMALGIPKPIHLGTCLVGLPVPVGSGKVLGGVTATELILVDLEGQIAGKIPWRSIKSIVAGDETTVASLLAVGPTLPSLMLTAVRPEKENRKHPPGFLVVDWEPQPNERRQLVCRFESTFSAEVLAKFLEVRQQLATLRPA